MATHPEFECSICNKTKAEIPLEDSDDHTLHCDACQNLAYSVSGHATPMTDHEFQMAVSLQADLMNSWCARHPAEDILEVLMHSTASFVDQIGRCCFRGVIEFEEGEKWAFNISSHDEEVELTANLAKKSNLLH